jgi:acetoin utilization deacetylase AcuC-like enzyme
MLHAMRKVVYSPAYECDIGPHVFPTRKYRLVIEALLAAGTTRAAAIAQPEPVTRQALERVHSGSYLDDFFALRATPRILQSELPITAAIRDAAILAAGGTLLAARHALADGAAVHVGGGFHHAMPGHAEGFCYINDIAVAIRCLQAEGRIRRAAVLDTDVHQGNGTARIFQGDATVFTFSIHQENNYPLKERSDWDIGLDDGTGDDEYLGCLEPAVNRILDAEAPDLVIAVAGADPYHDDLLGGLGLSRRGLERRDQLVAAACAARGIALTGVLAGGYARQPQDTVAIHVATAAAILGRESKPGPR